MIAHPAWIEIDLAQFKKNIAAIRKHIGKRLFCLPVKANAYGHGLIPMSLAACEAGVDYLAVAHLQEGALLREAGILLPILVLGAIHEDQVEDLLRYNLEFSISSKFKADLVTKKCQRKCRVHLEVDTGMQRTGVRVESAAPLYEYMRGLGCLDIVGIYSHLATADIPNHPFTKTQVKRFVDLIGSPPFNKLSLIRHLANSAGVVYYPEAYLDMVRPSLLTFGYSEDFPDVAPCFSLKAKISYFKVVGQGEGIGYGHSYVTKKSTRIVTIPVGYGDGYLRELSNKGSVLIRGKRYPIVGTICMDQFMVDIGDDEAYVGEEVVLLGSQGKEFLSVLEIAKRLGTIPYEILSRLNHRLPRIYR